MDHTDKQSCPVNERLWSSGTEVTLEVVRIFTLAEGMESLKLGQAHDRVTKMSIH